MAKTASTSFSRYWLGAAVAKSQKMHCGFFGPRMYCIRHGAQRRSDMRTPFAYYSSVSSSSFFSVPMAASLLPSFCLMSSPIVPPAASAAAERFGVFDARCVVFASVVVVPAGTEVATSPLRIDSVIRRSCESMFATSGLLPRPPA